MDRNLLSLLLPSNRDYKSYVKYRRYYNEIDNSGLFNHDFYNEMYEDVSGDALTHYLVKGYKEGKLPSLDFDPDFYQKAYPDVKQADLNPLFHYVVYGKSEGKFIQQSYSIRRKNEICETNLAFLSNYEFDTEPLVSIIILNKDGMNHLKRLFKDFDAKTNYSNYEIIVVDNASVDESVNYLKSLDLPITIIENDINVSFSKGNNDAAKIANGEYLLLLNNDIEPTYGWLNELVGTIVYNEDVASVGAKLVFPFYFNANRDQSYEIQHSGDIFAERMYPCCLYAVNKSDSRLNLFDSSLTRNNQCVAVTGAVNLIDRKVYDELSGLDEEYFYGLEDVDFCLKLHKKGYKVLFAGNALLFHHESSTRVKSESYFENDKRNYSIFWNKWGQYLSRCLLLDKINSRKFFTEKNLKITIIDSKNEEDKELIHEISKKFNDLDYTVELISDLENYYIGNSTDILLSFNDDYDLNNMIARKDIVKVIVNNHNLKTDNYDICVSLNEIKSDCKNNIIIKDDFANEFLDNLEKILIDGYEF
ncbi:MAG: glycosyltransferase family 2 protein [Methanobrevibacter sp.]|uniref:glycosyltransferase family 2 protein n=1 Tax=Methanobrevibacter sp. TaxID=66852 RepID=UPI0025CF19BE|nr:glycosyltransferase family 2 protein [Methanobrevibacter sp.]MBR0270956.1 glycosyltransferase family 2 protein [Methanobrevibacter sp.]